MKKTLALALALAMVLGLTACGGGGGTSRCRLQPRSLHKSALQHPQHGGQQG